MLKICKWILEQLLHRAIEYQRVKASIVRCHSNMFTYLCSQPMLQHQKVFQHIKSFLKANNILKASRFLLLVYSHFVNSHLVNFPLCQHWTNGNWRSGKIPHCLQFAAVCCDTGPKISIFLALPNIVTRAAQQPFPKFPWERWETRIFVLLHGNTFVTFQRFQV